MPPKEIAIKVDHVYKDFKLPHLRRNTLKSYFTTIFDSSEKSKDFEVQHALKNVSFEIEKGEFFGIVGRNGSGKSTLLKMIAGIYQPSKGSIQVNGKLVPFIELGVGFNPELTGRENIFLNGSLLGFTNQQISDMYFDIVKFAELEKFMDQKLKNYSSGMQVRLAFSMAVRAEADILLVDEVLAVGDADFQRKCFAYFRALKKHNKTVVFVSHDMNAVREYCDRAILIEDSVLIEEGTSGKIANSYTKLFINTGSDDENEAAKKAKRWGNGNLHYTKVTVNPKSVTEEEEIILHTEIEVRKDLDDAIFGFSIKNSADTLLFGTNTQLQGKKFKNLKNGETLQLDWKMPNILNDGEYFITVAAETGAAIPCDWWEEAVKLKVLKESQTGFVAYPKIGLDVTHGEKN